MNQDALQRLYVSVLKFAAKKKLAQSPSQKPPAPVPTVQRASPAQQ
jgi:hypothetical protein